MFKCKLKTERVKSQKKIYVYSKLIGVKRLQFKATRGQIQVEWFYVGDLDRLKQLLAS